MTASLCGSSHTHLGTPMPSGGGHIINARPMPKPKTIPFALELRLWPETVTDVEARLRRFLIERRRRRAEASPAAVEPPEDEYDPLGLETPALIQRRPTGLSFRDDDRIRKRARALMSARDKISGAAHMRKEDLERLRGITGGVELRGPSSEHDADEIAARLFEEAPWHARVIEILWRDMRAGARAGDGLRFRPVLFDGPPGLGKTHLALRLAELAAVPMVYVDVATASEGFTLAGAQRTWSSASPGRPVSTILQTRVGNPVCFVDEVEKGGTHHSAKGGVPTSAHLALLSLLEPISASKWECPYFGTSFDMGHVNWLLASNDARLLPPPLASRLRIVPVRGPSRAELLAFAARELARRGLDEEALSTVEVLVRAYPEGDERLNLRTVVRLIEDLSAIHESTEVCH